VTTGAATAIGLWLAITLPLAALIGTWGWALLRRERGLGRALIGWAAALPVAPPLLTLGTWLLFGDAHPPGSQGSTEVFSYYQIAAYFSFGAAVIATPLFLVIALFWVLAAPSARQREPELLDDPPG